MLSEDLRHIAISAWLTLVLDEAILAIVPASSDASFRRYFRVTTADRCLIAMDAPPERENMRAFLKVARLLDAAGVRVPQIFNYDLTRGFMLLEDFGSQCYLEALAEASPDVLYTQAFASLLKLQGNTLINSSQLPQYDVPLLTRELGVFYEWFLETFLMLKMPLELRASLNQLLITSALEQPQTFVHRDFHSRNLMVLQASSPGVIDFQDAVKGPITYDLVSLLKDCYIEWPAEKVDLWRDEYWHLLGKMGCIAGDKQQFKRWFDLMGLQRHLKAIGIFARLHLRDGKSGYLADIPRTLGYVTTVCDAYPELSAMAEFLQQQVLPTYQQSL